MQTAALVGIIIVFIMAGILALLSYRSFKEKGFLLNNAYLYATEEERKTMDKKPWYRQSAIVFALLCIACILLGIYLITEVKFGYDARFYNIQSGDYEKAVDMFYTEPKGAVSEENGANLEALREKYPEYFDMGTFKGLEVYVCQMAPDSYSCGVMAGTNRDKTLEELMSLKWITIAEMRAILSTYDIDEKDIFVIPWQNPVSSYLADYWISQEDEDPAAAEKRKQEYIEGIRQMLFGDA